MIVAIHQPNFFPWLGYFDKIARADVFVFLDGVGYPKNSWVNRVKVAVQGKAQWITCPVQRTSASGTICEVLIDEARDWRGRILKTLHANYARAPRFGEAMDVIAPLIGNRESRLADFNIAAIKAVSACLGLETRFVRQSTLQAEGVSNALLVSLVRACGGETYLMGGGAAGYHDDEPFRQAGIRVVRQDFLPFEYGAEGSFIPGLSAIDYLMHDRRELRAASVALQ